MATSAGGHSTESRSEKRHWWATCRTVVEGVIRESSRAIRVTWEDALMRGVLVMGGVLGSLVALVVANDDVESSADEETSRKIERVVVPVEGVREFTVTGRSTRFRLTATTIAGGTIEQPVVEGPAKLVRTSEIERVGKGGEPLIGSAEKQFEFRGTGGGTVKISIKKTLPTQPMPIVDAYRITIK